MLTFFRRIRRSLMGSGAPTRKYLLYAIGEILLVMIGILLALQINNWNEDQKNRSTEKELIFDFRNALESDVINIIRPQLEQVSRSVSEFDVLLYYIDEDLPFHDSIKPYFRHLTQSYNFLPRITVYKDFESKGLNIIRDKEIKNAILDIYNMEYPRMQLRIENHYYNLRDYGRPIFRNRFRWNPGGAVPIDFESLKKDPELRNVIAIMRSNNNAHARHLKELEQKIRELIVWIEKRY